MFLPPNIIETIVGIPNLNNQQLPQVKEILNQVGGVTWAGYCGDQHLLLLKVDRNVQVDNKLITEKLLSVNPVFKIYFKEGSFADALNTCIDHDKALLR